LPEEDTQYKGKDCPTKEKYATIFQAAEVCLFLGKFHLFLFNLFVIDIETGEKLEEWLW